MPQARRIKPKRAPAKKKKASKSRNIPWGLMLIILVSGIVLGALLNGARNGDAEFGAGLRALFESTESATEDEDTAIKELVENKSSESTEKQYDFYELLLDIEKIMPDDLPESQPQLAQTNLDYYLQAASFRKHADAEKLRARLALKGYKCVTQARTTEDKGTFYRVRVGPYGDKRKAKTAKNRLKKLGVNPFVFSVKKNAG